MKFYYTKGKDEKPRHVVVANEEPVDGKVSVTRVGFHPSVEGLSRRGKRPKLDGTVDVQTLTEMSDEEVTDSLKREAQKVLAQPAQDTTSN